MKLYDSNRDCCGCAACMSICSKKAIIMKSDIDGFIYPVINKEMCIDCGMCIQICAFKNKPVNDKQPITVYAAINKDSDILSSSTSGGVFSALSAVIFEKNGVVFGSSYNNEMEPIHICVDNFKDLEKLRGSKYIQSYTNTSFADAKNYLEQGRWVLYTGTPCQIAGLKSFLKQEYSTLITSDIICHGTPSAAFFKGYIGYFENKFKGKVVDFKFRDIGYTGKCTYLKNNIIKQKSIYPLMSYYYNYFLEGNIMRETCYRCPYATSSREGDFTMGDYWGIEEAHPEIDAKNGVSVLLVNSMKGLSLIEELSDYLILTKSTLEKASKKNVQLRQPSKMGQSRREILEIWRNGGYRAVAHQYNKQNWKRIYIFKSKMLIPKSMKSFLKKILWRNRNVHK